MKKEIICTERSVAVLQNLQKILEVIFGKIDIKCFTISEDNRDMTGSRRYIWATVMTSFPLQKLDVVAEFAMIMVESGMILDPNTIQHLRVDGPDKYKNYVIWNHPDLGVVKITGRMKDSPVWIVGSSINDRSTEPFYEFQTLGLSYDI